MEQMESLVGSNAGSDHAGRSDQKLQNDECLTLGKASGEKTRGSLQPLLRSGSRAYQPRPRILRGTGAVNEKKKKKGNPPANGMRLLGRTAAFESECKNCGQPDWRTVITLRAHGSPHRIAAVSPVAATWPAKLAYSSLLSLQVESQSRMYAEYAAQYQTDELLI